MQWNLRLAAAQRGIWRSSDLRRLLADAGLEISAGKMSHLWSGRPISVRDPNFRDPGHNTTPLDESQRENTPGHREVEAILRPLTKDDTQPPGS